MALWIKLIPQAISLVEMASRVLASNKKHKQKAEDNKSIDPAILLKRIEVLENNEVQQAELIQQMAQQNLTLIKKAESNYKLALTAVYLSIFLVILSTILFLVYK